MSRNRRSAALTLLLLAACLTACDKDPAAPDGDVTRLPASRDEVAAHLQTAYEQRNVDAMALLLPDDYVFTFSPGSLYGTTWDRTDELDALDQLFAGRTGLDPLTNAILSGVTVIDVVRRSRMQEWQSVGDDFEALYEVEVRFTLGDGTRYTVAGEQRFRVREVTVTEDGAEVRRWQLLRHEDLIPGLGRSTDWTWGDFKRCYLR